MNYESKDSLLSSSNINIENKKLPNPPIFPIINLNSICIHCYKNEGLIYRNSLCRCVYMYHRECMAVYINYRDNCYRCPLCLQNHIISPFQLYYLQQFLGNSHVLDNRSAQNEALNIELNRFDIRNRNLWIISMLCSCLAGIIYLIIVLILRPTNN